MSWTEDRVAILKKLWGEGKTAAEIAKELGGVTRNAVIGKAHRLKLSNRVSPIQQNKKPAPKVVATTAPKVLAANTAPKERKVSTPANMDAPAPKLPSSKNKGPKIGGNIPLADLKPNECRWADGDPKEEDFGFCGCKTLPGLPYCAEHAKIAYQAATRNRILKSEAAEYENVSEAELMAAKKVVNQK
tara:strand:+ start:999 stop:1562 length:564 start_codon:yes stop_codon:yes gene_type:complete